MNFASAFAARQLKPLHIVAVASVMLISSSGAKAGIVVTDAKIAGGRLIVSGTSDLGETVSLDGHYRAEVANKNFVFSLVYSPASCIISLGAPGTTAPNVRAVIANCAPTPFNPMGEWQSDIQYQPNDLVERNGATFVALANARPNRSEDPLLSTSFWRALPAQTATAERTLLIGPKGERGEAGRDGAKGERGESGALAGFVMHTIKADITRPAFENGQAKGEWKIISGGSLPVTIGKGDDGYDSELLVAAATLSDFSHCTMSATIFDAATEKMAASVGQMKIRGDMIAIPLASTRESIHFEALLLCPRAK